MLLQLLELASNKTLEYDAASRERLEKLHGKTLTLRITTLNQAVTLAPQPSGLEFSEAQADDVTDVTLSMTLNALVKISRQGFEDAELEAGELEMQGDPIIGQRFAQLIAKLDIDWQALLAEQLGPAPARFITTAAHEAKSMADNSKETLKARLKTFINDDIEVVADHHEVDAFLNSVDELRADVDRLFARLSRLNG